MDTLVKNLEIEFAEFNQEKWNDYLNNILYNKPFYPRLPETETDPTLVLCTLISIFGFDAKFNNTIRLIVNSLEYHYDKIKVNADPLNIDDCNALEAIFTTLGQLLNSIVDKDLLLIVKLQQGHKLRLFTNYINPSTKRNLHFLLEDVIKRITLPSLP